MPRTMTRPVCLMYPSCTILHSEEIMSCPYYQVVMIATVWTHNFVVCTCKLSSLFVFLPSRKYTSMILDVHTVRVRELHITYISLPREPWLLRRHTWMGYPIQFCPFHFVISCVYVFVTRTDPVPSDGQGTGLF